MQFSSSRLWLPIAILFGVGITQVSADTIRVKGPNGEVLAAPQYSQVITREVIPSAEPSQFYGPVSSEETLWQIATRFRPDAQVSTQQMLLAIYQLNPSAFEAQNIHKLIPGSSLRIPSPAQVQSVTTEQAVRVMNSHQARLTATPAVTPEPVVTPELMPEPAPIVAAQPEVIEPPQTAAPTSEQVASPVPEPAVEPSVSAEPTQVKALKQELELSESELMALEERNHQLRLMLADVQNELSVLRDEVTDEQRIRGEVEKMLQLERERLAEQQRLAPSGLDKLANSPIWLTLLAVIPGLLILAGVIALIKRRTQPSAEPQPDSTEPQAPMAGAPQVLALDSDDEEEGLLLDEELFADADLYTGDQDRETDKQPDIFADLGDDDSLDLSLDDDSMFDVLDGGDIDEELDQLARNASNTTVGTDEKPLGLEEMERVLDDVDLDTNLSDDFDLSEDEEIDVPFITADEEPLLGDTLDQQMLDELLQDLTPSTSDSSEQALDDELELTSDSLELDSLDDNTALLDELLDEQELIGVDQESTDLLDELVASSEQDLDLSDSEQMLDELLSEDDESWADTLLNGDDASLSDGTELFDELLEIEQSSVDQTEQPSVELDAPSRAPEHDSLAEQNSELSTEIDLPHSVEPELSLIETQDAGLTHEHENQFDANANANANANADANDIQPAEVIDLESANEFGVPQDDDWLIESAKETQAEPAAPTDMESTEPELDSLDTTHQAPELTGDTSSIEEQAPEPIELDSAQTSDELETAALDIEPTQDDFHSLDDSKLAEFTQQDTPDDAEEPLSQPMPQPEALQAQTDEALHFDEEQLPEFTEQDALGSIDEMPEPMAELESPLESLPTTDEPLHFDDAQLPQFTEQEALGEDWSDDGDAISFDQTPLPEPLSHEIEDLAHATEEVTHASKERVNAADEDISAHAEQSSDFLDDSLQLDPEQAQEQDALFDLFQAGDVSSDAAQQIDEEVLNDWLSETETEPSVPLESANFSPEQVDTAGLDIDSMLEMGGEDWNGFKLDQATGDIDEAQSDIPAEEQPVWQQDNPVAEAKLEDEDWSQQHEFNPSDAQFKTIEQLMAEADEHATADTQAQEEELDLNVGLDEFPDVIGEVDFADVDLDAEASGKIDLAKIYLEMNDTQGAIKLLEEAIVDGNDQVRREAKNLIDDIRS
ncbi:FimV/HubP family polar landmark protein [Vibrio sp. WXL103]|uniref:FimV/HubP family polar landmark protein n=1 Tax=Vibrio sp. WXL103 TaxID=3450710 RepID=UPI003EC58AF7